MASRNVLRITFTEEQARYMLMISMELSNDEPAEISPEDRDIAASLVTTIGTRLASLNYGGLPSYTKVPPKPSTLESLGGTEPDMTPEEEEIWAKEVHANSVRLQAEVDAKKVARLAARKDTF